MQVRIYFDAELDIELDCSKIADDTDIRDYVEANINDLIDLRNLCTIDELLRSLEISDVEEA